MRFQTKGGGVPAVAGLAIAGSLLLTGCGELRTAFGGKATAPDEFAVVARAPLSQPPGYTLRPPAPGAERPQEQSVRQGAEQLVLKGEGTGTVGAGTFHARPPGGAAPTTPIEGSDSAFQQMFGGDKLDPNIRELVNSETAVYVYQEEYLLEKLLFWKPKPEPGVVLDPDGERKRLQENAALGRPADSGESPTIKRRETGILEKLFN